MGFAAGASSSITKTQRKGGSLVFMKAIASAARAPARMVRGEGVTRGRDEAEFHLADYYRGEGLALPDIPFLETVTYPFGLEAEAEHYHLPLKMTPWGFSLFRGN